MITTYQGKQRGLELRAVLLLAKHIHQLARKQEHVVLGLCGGRSVSGVFSLLAHQPLPWKKIHIFLTDEVLVPENHKSSNFGLLRRTLAGPLVASGKLPEDHVHPFVLEKKKDCGTSSYAAELKNYGGKFDVLLLSSGEDGHVGALYPAHRSFASKAQFFLPVMDGPKKPKKRMTFSKQLLSRSSAVVLLFFGHAKREAYLRFSDPSVSECDCPAKLVCRVPHAHVLVDVE